MKNQLTGNSGLFYICWELSRRGWNVLITSRNTRGSDLLALSQDEETVRTIQSKALSKKADVPLGSNLDNLRSDYWIVTVGANDAQPSCYVLLTRGR